MNDDKDLKQDVEDKIEELKSEIDERIDSLQDKIDEEKAELKQKGFVGWVKDNTPIVVGAIVIIVLAGAILFGNTDSTNTPTEEVSVLEMTE